MFEKEAEEYVMREDVITENDKVPFDNGYGFQTVSFEDEVKKGFQDGAEFGYNKANEWHYVKDELPSESAMLLLARKTINGVQALIGYYRSNQFEIFNEKSCVMQNIDSVYAWKEIVFPELTTKEKQYRPFNNCGELIEYWYDFTGVINCSPKLFMPTIWVKHKRYGTENLITAFDNDNESIGGSCVFIQDIWVDMRELFDNFTFLDGSPCGLEE